MRIDAHQHYWALQRGDYGWLTPNLTEIYRDFGPQDLAPHLDAFEIGGSILVQAAPTVAETHHMLDLSDTYSSILGVVGWVDFDAPDAQEAIRTLSRHPKLVGFRPMIQDIPNRDWMLRPNLAPVFDALIDEDRTFDALTLPEHLPNLMQLLNSHPDMRVVIDHGSKPLIRDGILDPWAGQMTLLANETNAFCKLSGLVTEAGRNWSVKHLRPYVDHLLETFGPERLIWGSDWPVCLLASSYEQWWETTEQLLTGLTKGEKAAIMGGNALRAYRLAMT